MNTKILVALVIGIALVGLTGSASAAYYDLNADYTYLDNAVNEFDSTTKLNAKLSGDNADNSPFFMHSKVKNKMKVSNIKADGDVLFGVMQAGGNSLTITTAPGPGGNTFVSSANAVQGVGYAAEGDIYKMDFAGSSDTHESTHYGILPLNVRVDDKNCAIGGARVSKTGCGCCGDPEASIKTGSIGYVCNSNARVDMEAKHVQSATAGSGIMMWADAQGEIWLPGGKIMTGIGGGQSVSIDWWDPNG